MKTFLLIVIVLPAAIVAYAQSAEEHTRLYKQFEREGNIAEAVRHAEEAMKIDKKGWRVAWDLGELLLYKTENRTRALEVFTEAKTRGYDKPITYHKQAMCYFHLGKYETAIDLLEQSIRANKDVLEQAIRKKDDGAAHHARFQIGDSYIWLTKQYHVLENDEKFLEAARQVEVYDPKSQWFPTVLHDGISRVLYKEVAAGNLQRALELCREEEALVKKYNHEPDWRVPRYTLHEVLEKRIALGKISPVYTHKALAIYFNNLQSSYAWKGKDFPLNRTMLDREKRTAILYQKVLTMMIEAITDGQLSMSWDSIVVNEPIREVKASADVNDEAEVEPVWSSNNQFTTRYRQLCRSYDTFFKVWNGPTLEAKGGGGRIYPDLPIKGSVRIQPEHSLGIWLHEFFHVVESKIGISPTHGYYKETRGSFPGWTGPTDNQLDYFRWHFNTTVKNFGFANFRFD